MKRNLTICALAFMLAMLLLGFGTFAFASEANSAQEIGVTQGQAEVWLQGAGMIDDNHLLLVTPGETGPTCTVNFLNGQPNTDMNAAIHTPAGTLIFTGLSGANPGSDWNADLIAYTVNTGIIAGEGKSIVESKSVVIDINVKVLAQALINGVTVTNAVNAQAIGQGELLDIVPSPNQVKLGEFNLTGSRTENTVTLEGDFAGATIILDQAGKVIYDAKNADLYVLDDSEVRDGDGKELKTCDECRVADEVVVPKPCGHALCNRCLLDLVKSKAHSEPAACGVEGHFACQEGDHATKLNCGHFACEAGDHQNMHPCNKHYACQAGDHLNRHPCGRHYACQAGTHNKRNCGHYECLAGDHSSLECGHYACKKGNHTTKRECGHFACQTGDHVNKLKCGHFACDTSKNHAPAPCKIYKHFLCDGLTHTSAACACEIKGHLDCDGKNHDLLSCGVHYACVVPEWQTELHVKCAHCEKGFCTSGHSSCEFCWVKYCESQKPYIPSEHGVGVCACICGNKTWHTKLGCGHYECQAATGDHSALPCGDYVCQIATDSNHSALPCGHYACKGGDHALLPCQVAAHGYVCTVTPDEQTQHALCGDCGEPLCRLLAHGIGFCKCGGCGRTDAVHPMNNCGHYGCEDTPTGAHGRLPCWTHIACEIAQAEWPDHEPCPLCNQSLCAGAHGADVCVCGKCGTAPAHTILPCGHYECEVAPGEDHTALPCGHYRCKVTPDEDHSALSCGHYVCLTGVGADHLLPCRIVAHGYFCTIPAEEWDQHDPCSLCGQSLCVGTHGAGICACGGCGAATLHAKRPCGHYECEVAPGEDHSQCSGTGGCGGYMCDLQDHQRCSYCDHCQMCVGLDHGLCTLCSSPLCLGTHGQGICR